LLVACGGLLVHNNPTMKMTGAQALVRQLIAEGVDTVFALPGVQVMAIFDALHEHRDSIRLVQGRSEMALTHMADGYARVTGKPGVAIVVPGPGALYASGGLGTAYGASSPVLLVSAQIPSDALGKRRGELHEIEDQLDVFKPITKWNARSTQVAEIPGMVREAFDQMGTGRPRPVEIEIPTDTLSASDVTDMVEPEPAVRMAPKNADIRKAVQALASAECPIIFAGGGTAISGASGELTALAETLGAPVMTTPQARGVIDPDHPLYLGVNYAQLTPGTEVMEYCDVLVAVGTRLLLPGLNLSGKTLIQIDVDPEEIGRNFRPEVKVPGDAALSLAAISDGLDASGFRLDTRATEDGKRFAAKWKKKIANEITKLAPEQTAIVDTIAGELDDDDIVVSGITNIGYWSHVRYPVRTLRSYITTSYFIPLGYAYPTALGAKVAAPDRKVVAISGDGGFLYMASEMSTAAAHGIGAVAVVFNNSAFGASNWDQTHRFGERYLGTELQNPDFVKLAEAHGVRAESTDPDGLGPALRRALDADAPALVEVKLPNMMPPFQIVN
jgi:acetolactate synthase-1/2/3 large subunit